MSERWLAPVAGLPVEATVALPGSKSITNRALVLAALAADPTRLRRPLRSRDTDLMAAGLRALGVIVDEDGETGEDWVVEPRPLVGEVGVDVGNAGTVMRFLPPVACLADGPVTFDGDPRARERPMGPVLDALAGLGADLEWSDAGGLPVTVHGRGGLAGGEVTIDASGSSQFVSALLLTGSRFDQGVVVRHEGPDMPSLPHVDLTVAMLRAARVAVDDSEANCWRVAPGTPAGGEMVVEPDLSNAAPFLAAAMVTGGQVTVPDWPQATNQPGDLIREILGELGGDISQDEHGLTVIGPPTPAELVGADLDLHECGELAPTVAAVCALASTPSSLYGLAHLRGHETDRLAALAVELSRLGAAVSEAGDGLDLAPVDRSRLHGGEFRTYDDHRLATAAAVVGLVVHGVEVTDIATTAKTLPDFTERWADLLAQSAAAGRQ